MPRLRIGETTTDVRMHGSVWDLADLLASLTRRNVRSFVDGPWGAPNVGLAREMQRRCLTPPCVEQCFISSHTEGATAGRGCSCASGWQYTSDEDVQMLEGCPPDDVWNDAAALLHHHRKVGRGDNDPILCDCDDLTAICAGVAKFDAWQKAGAPMRDRRPREVDGADVRIAITRPHGKDIAHAYMLSPWAPKDEPEIALKVDGKKLYVFDGAGRWGMRRPSDDFYGNGEVAVYPIRFEDL